MNPYAIHKYPKSPAVHVLRRFDPPGSESGKLLQRLSWIIGLALGVVLLSACATPNAGASPPTENDTGVQENLNSPQVQVTLAPSSTPGEPAPQVVRAPLEDLGPAPELTNQVWLNVDGPLLLADLRGKVVLLDMWTFG